MAFYYFELIDIIKLRLTVECMMNSLNKNGFTLSEVLLVLTVIGVVASLTIPTLIQRLSNDQAVPRVKKTFSTLQQAYNAILLDNGGSITGSLFVAGNSNTNIMNTLSTKLNFVKNCGTNSGCLYSSAQYLLSGNAYSANTETSYASWGKAVLADGTLLRLNTYNNDCAYSEGALVSVICANVDVDINGMSGPNTVGRDVFSFWVTKDGIMPKGSKDLQDCITTTNGWGCSSKVLIESKINY